MWEAARPGQAKQREVVLAIGLRSGRVPGPHRKARCGRGYLDSAYSRGVAEPLGRRALRALLAVEGGLRTDSSLGLSYES